MLRLIRTQPKQGDYTQKQIDAMIATRRDQNKKLIAIAWGESDAVPVYVGDVIPGVENVDLSSMLNPPEELSAYAMEFRFVEAVRGGVLGRIQTVSSEVSQLLHQHKITIPDGELPASVRASYKEEADGYITAILAAHERNAPLWMNSAFISLCAITQYLKTIDKNLDYLGVTLPKVA